MAQRSNYSPRQDLNVVNVLGHLSKDAEMFQAGNNNVVEFRIAINNAGPDGQGTWVEKPATFIQCTWWGKRAEAALDYLVKGKQVLIQGKLILDEWEDENKQLHSMHKIGVQNVQLLGGTRTDEPQEAAPARGRQPVRRAGQATEQVAPARTAARTRRAVRRAEQQAQPVGPIQLDDEAPF